MGAKQITDRQITAMARAFDLVLRFQGDNCSGLMARGSTGRLCRELEARGLMRFMGFASDIDGEDEQERPTYSVTPRGALLLFALKETEAEELDQWRKNYARLLCLFDPPRSNDSLTRAIENLSTAPTPEL